MQVREIIKNGLKSNSAKILLSVNFIPIIGVMFFDWNLFSIMFLYWLENLVIGIYSLLKIKKTYYYLISKQKNLSVASRVLATWGQVMSFVFNYGLYTIVHGVFVIAMFGMSTATSPTIVNLGPVKISDIIWPEISILGILLSFIMLIISHGFSYYNNFIAQEEYKYYTINYLSKSSFERVIALHFIIVISGFIILAMGYSKLTIVILIIIKTLIDFYAHSKEHGKKINSDIL
ncbi:MAG: DUF6498-containing protein [Patescibacteria group bacterium]